MAAQQLRVPHGRLHIRVEVAALHAVAAVEC
eukprot:COSAG05_NODE_514_length_9082_cov_6.915730_1_plen_31_part_00